MDLDADVFSSSFFEHQVEQVPEELVIFLDDSSMLQWCRIFNAVSDGETLWIGNVRGEQFARM